MTVLYVVLGIVGAVLLCVFLDWLKQKVVGSDKAMKEVVGCVMCFKSCVMCVWVKCVTLLDHRTTSSTSAMKEVVRQGFATATLQ